MDEILEDVLEKIQPTEKEQEKLSEISEDLIERAREISSDIDAEAEPRLVGSAARQTWLSDKQEIDLFLLFPKHVSREEMEEKGLEIGKKISGEDYSEQYAEHPYINTQVDGFDVDIVPCYDIDDPSKLKSSVDRSPHHQDYVKGWLKPEHKKQVLLLKKFLKGIGAYGSELKVHGFSGYLCELLIIKYKSFKEVIKSASNWGSKKIIANTKDRSEEVLEEIFPDQPLIYIDPVDPGRNVAAAVSKKNYATFIRAAQNFIKKPKKTFFFPNEPPTSEKHLRSLIEERGTQFYTISLDIPFELVPDIIYPQLRKTEKSITKKLEKAGYNILRSDVWFENQKALILLELSVSELPSVKKHIGPPVDVDATPFIQTHIDSKEKKAGPYVNEDGRLVFELGRKQTKALDVLKDVIESSGGFGKHIEKTISEKGYEIFENEKIVGEMSELGSIDFLGEYLTNCLPWYG